MLELLVRSLSHGKDLKFKLTQHLSLFMPEILGPIFPATIYFFHFNPYMTHTSSLLIMHVKIHFVQAN